MKKHSHAARIFCLFLACVIICSIASVPASAQVLAPSKVSSSATEATTTDELLAAIAPGATIVLTGDSYMLTEASDYGEKTASDYYRWEEVFDGYQLVIDGVQGLSIIGADNPVISAEPRYADVIVFEDCDTVYLENFTAGHTTEPGYCSGGVIRLSYCSMVSLKRCSLYGCGILGIDAAQCKGLSVIECDIYECSYGAVQLFSCEDAVFENCSLRDCGNEDELYFALLNISDSSNIYVLNSAIYGNKCSYLISESFCRCVFLAGCTVEDNLFETVFNSSSTGTFVIGCAFARNDFASYYSGIPVCMDEEGNRLAGEDFYAMKQENAKLSALKEIKPPVPETELPAERSGYYVSNVDELVAAIAPDTTIILADGIFDLSTASSYVSPVGGYYYWNSCYDGPELVISGVSNLAIFYSAESLEDAANCTIAAVPRYADVLKFENCDHIILSGFTAGHTKEPGECSGGVLQFYNCSDVYIDNCRMYGCGTVGIETQNCTDITVTGCEIYECSYSGADIWSSKDISFENCIIRDIRAEEMLNVGSSKNVYWNGQPVYSGNYKIEDGVPVAIDYGYYENGAYDYPAYYTITLSIGGEEFSGSLSFIPGEDSTVTLSAQSDRPAGEQLPFSWFCMSPAVKLNPNEDGSECEITLLRQMSSPAIVMVKQGNTEYYFTLSSK